MTPKEALENIKREAGIPYFSSLYDIDDWRDDFKTIETALNRLEEIENTSLRVLREDISKRLKALEIIVKKGVAVGMLQLKEVGVKEYNDFIGDTKLYLTQEEYDFLKEVLE